MNRKIITTLWFAAIASLLLSCGSKPIVNDKPKLTENVLKNEGSLCLVAQKNNDLTVFYLPLNTTCTSSSLNRWKDKKLTASVNLRRGVKNSTVSIDTSATHLRSDSKIATADCAGAGIQSKTLSMNGVRAYDVFWGKYKIGGIENHEGAILCKHLDKNGTVVPAPQLHNQVRAMARRH